MSLCWFLFRVIPKPIRATYPCQQAAFPVTSTFVLWLLGLKCGLRTWLDINNRAKRLGSALTITCLVCLVALAAIAAVPKIFTTRFEPNTPKGVGRGIFPGRVAWVHNTNAVSWSSGNYWWNDKYNNQPVIDDMVSQAVQCVAGQKDAAAAWAAIFHNFNQQHHKGDVGYVASEKIAIKINQNNHDVGTGNDNNQIDASPHMVLALLKSLINQAGVTPGNITVFDASRRIPDSTYNKCHGFFPEVVFVDHIGGNGRVAATYVANAIPFSKPTALATGLATCVVQADYVINMALLKAHYATGVTLCGKNFYGATSIDWSPPKNFAGHDFFNHDKNGRATYMPFVDFMGHKDLGGKTLLFMLDGLYSCKGVNGEPGPKWQMPPFNNAWPASLFVSQDGVAVDSVGVDFLAAEWPGNWDMAYCDTYLDEAAMIPHPPSGTLYKPDGVTILTNSLGVHEHWNNSVSKQYSRNLGTGSGIELVLTESSILSSSRSAR